MPFKLKPSEEKFFQYLIDHAEIMLSAVEQLRDAFSAPGDELMGIIGSLDQSETKADEIVDKVMRKLHKTFITPLDREDIYTLIQKLDDIVDVSKSIVERLYMYNAAHPSPGAVELADLAYKGARQVSRSIAYLTELKKHHLKVEARCNRLVALEADADIIYRREMAKLFRDERDPVEIIKWKEIYTGIEELMDTMEDVARILKKVVLKYA